MSCFRNFTVPHWEVFGGNLLMFVTIVFYILWWTISFRPNAGTHTAGAGISIAIALFTGMASIAVMALGIISLAQEGKGFPFLFFLLGAVLLYIILLAVTKIFFQREVTSELFLIVFWLALQCSAVAVLYTSGRFNIAQTLTVLILLILTTIFGMVCYVLHYRLEEPARFWNGLIPLIVDAGAVAVFLSVLALS